MSEHILILPHLHIQNANAISSPLTWGFPAMTAFIGLMQALERRCAQAGLALRFHGIGVVCHAAKPQTCRSPYGQHSFLLTRNPLKYDGKTAAIVEEGRMHIELSLVLILSGCEGTQDERIALANQLDDFVHHMRIAGGSVLPRENIRPESPRRQQYYHEPHLEPLALEDDDQYTKQLNRLKRRLLPGFALILREDVLTQHKKTLQETQPNASLVDIWLDISRFNYRYDADKPEKQHWPLVRRPSGWLVPIPIGYCALSDEIPANDIANARDSDTPLRFVEPLFSIGEWRSPHRLKCIEEMLWHIKPNTDERLFLLDMLVQTPTDDNSFDTEFDTTDY